MKKSLLFISAVVLLLSVSCDDNPYKQGKIYYELYCSNCHMEDGKGLKGLIPPVAQADYLGLHRSTLPCIIRKGQKGSILVNGVPYGEQEMLPIPQLTDFEITNILNYVGTSWGNKEKIWTVEEVRQSLKVCE